MIGFGSPLKIARFWLIEFWGRGWDSHRRRLLLKHYWAYFRNGDIPGEYLPDASATDLSEKEAPASSQASFSAGFRQRIESVQQGATQSRGVFLSYRPLGKNLRLLSTAIRENVDRGRKVYIEREGPPTEQRALAARGYHWSPWLWVRTNSEAREVALDAAQAWNELFQHPAAHPGGARAQQGGAPPHLETGAGPYSPRQLERLLKVAAATRYVFSPTGPVMDRVRALREAAGWPDPGRRVLGIHVRRGDAASTEDAPQQSTRQSFSLATYLETADQMCAKYGIRDIFLATESREEIERAKRLRPQYRFLWLEYDRSLFPRIGETNQFIEDFALEHPERAKALATTAILDLYFFCECDAFIGAFNSEFSVLAWLLMIGSKGHLVPYLSLSKPAVGRSLNPFVALLNLRNNCPLELYHW